jgi:DNA invertase Pin-like site-specific DNA recombinase
LPPLETIASTHSDIHPAQSGVDHIGNPPTAKFATEPLTSEKNRLPLAQHTLKLTMPLETIEKLRSRDIGFRSLTEAIDTTTAQGVLVFHMFSALAEFERALIRERTRAGLAAAKRAGRTGGRPPKLSEDDLDVARTLLANPDIPVADVAERLGISPATLYRYLPAAKAANSPSL